jgi:hypothetical protein
MKYEDEFKLLVIELRDKTKALKNYSIAIMVLSTINIFLFVVGLQRCDSDHFIKINYCHPLLITTSCFFVGLFCLIILVRHSQLIKKGNILMDEISDDLEWNYRNNVNKPERIPIEYRLSLKDYHNAKIQFSLDRSYFQFLCFCLNFAIMIVSILIFSDRLYL